MFRRIAPIVTCAAAIASLAAAKPDAWISTKTNAQLWSRVMRMLESELGPDDPAEVASHTAAYRDKHLRRIAGDQVVLAVIGMRESARHPRRSEITAAFSIDLSSGHKEQLGTYVLWRFVKWAHFDADSVDAVFSYQTCDECEAERFVASFSYDGRNRAWKLRQWPDNGTRIVVGVDPEPDANEYQRCVYGIADYNGDSRDDIATWCRTRNAKTDRTISESLTIYSMSSTGPRKEIVIGEKAETVRHQLCRQTPTASACK